MLILALFACPSVPHGFPAERLVLALEHKLVAVILESVRYLCPCQLEAPHAFLLVFGEIIHPAVVVHIYDCVHSRIQRPINDLLDSRYIVGIDGVVSVVVYYIRPCNGYPQHAEARVSIALYSLLRDYGASPRGFIARNIGRCYPVAAGFHGVSEIYPVPHFLYHLHGGNITHIRIFLLAAAH